MSYETLSGSFNGRPIKLKVLHTASSSVIVVHDVPDAKKHLVTLEFGFGKEFADNFGTAAGIILCVSHNGDNWNSLMYLDQGILKLTMLLDGTAELGDSRVLVQAEPIRDHGDRVIDNYLHITGYVEDVT